MGPLENARAQGQGIAQTIWDRITEGGQDNAEFLAFAEKIQAIVNEEDPNICVSTAVMVDHLARNLLIRKKGDPFPDVEDVAARYSAVVHLLNHVMIAYYNKAVGNQEPKH